MKRIHPSPLNARQRESRLSRNYAIGGAPPSRRLTAWEVREGDSHCLFWFTVL